MKQKTIDFRELLERVLPIDDLPAAHRMQVQRALREGVPAEIERAGLQASLSSSDAAPCGAWSTRRTGSSGRSATSRTARSTSSGSRSTAQLKPTA